MRIVPRRRRSKKQQAGDALANAVKVWTELKVAKNAAKGAKKGARGAVKGASAAKGTATKPRLLVLVVAGVGAAVAAKKAKGGSSDVPETYSPPVGGVPPSAPKPEPNEEKPTPLSSATPGASMPPVTQATTTPTNGAGEAP